MSTSPSYKSGPILQRVADFITNLKFPGVPFSIRTPGVTDEAVLEEKKRRGQLGLDPDFYTTPQEDLGLTQPTPEFKADRQRRIEKVTGKSTLPVVKPPMPFDDMLAGQYQRYFKTPEFDGVFGAGARGTGAPEDAAAMEVLGNQIEAPEEDTNIASMYAAQSAMGRVNQDAIQDYFADTNLPGNVKLKDGRTALQAWAKANPMLAQREYLKAEAERAENAPMAPDGETMLRDLGGSAQYENPMGKEAYDAITAAREKLMKKAGSK